MRYLLKYFLSIVLVAFLFCGVKPIFCNFGRGHNREHSCGIILNLDQWLRRNVIERKSLWMHDKQRPITIAHPVFGSGELKTCQTSWTL